MTEGYSVEIEHDDELHTPHVPQYGLLASARAWAGITVADLFRDAHVLDRDAAYQLVDTITTITEADLPWTLTEPTLDVIVRIYPVERVHPCGSADAPSS
jgi:hypothetical protein